MEHISEAVKERNIILETNDPVVADGFTQVPNFILKNDALTVGEKITFAMFLTYAWNNDKVFPGQERLAKDTGVTRRSVNTFIKGLEKKRIPHNPEKGIRKDEYLHSEVSRAAEQITCAEAAEPHFLMCKICTSRWEIFWHLVEQYFYTNNIQSNNTQSEAYSGKTI